MSDPNDRSTESTTDSDPTESAEPAGAAESGVSAASEESTQDIGEKTSVDSDKSTMVGATAVSKDADPVMESDEMLASDDAGQARQAGSGPVWRRRFGNPGGRTLVTGFVILALLLTCGYLGFQLAEENRMRSARSTASASAKQYAIHLTSYDFRNLDGNFRAVTRDSSDKFAKEYKTVSDNLKKLIQKFKATSKGTILQQGVSSVDQERAVVALFVDQTITNTNSPQPRVDRNRMRMSLVRSGDRWLLDDVQLM